MNPSIENKEISIAMFHQRKVFHHQVPTFFLWFIFLISQKDQFIKRELKIEA
jgi:hypothetical protein